MKNLVTLIVFTIIGLSAFQPDKPKVEVKPEVEVKCRINHLTNLPYDCKPVLIDSPVKLNLGNQPSSIVKR